jgi:hypothetical protein
MQADALTSQAEQDINHVARDRTSRILVVTTESSSGKSDRAQARASGGQLAAGQTSWVGEQGPELITVGSNSSVMNHGASMALGGGGGGITVNVSGMIGSPAQLEVMIVDALRRYSRRNGGLGL